MPKNNFNVLKKIISFLRHNILGFDRSYLFELERRVTTLENIINTLPANNKDIWLFQNKSERMDATSDLFDEHRRKFHLSRYEFACSFVNNLYVADIACGTGYGTEILKLRGNARHVIGIDIAEEAIDYAIKHHNPLDTEFKVGSANNTKLPSESIDAIISFETIEHVDDDLEMLKEFFRILKPGGLLICSTPNQWPITQHHLRSYNKLDFEKIINTFFKLDKIFNQNSGCNSYYNHNQPFGIIETTNINYHLAECFIAICQKNNK